MRPRSFTVGIAKAAPLALAGALACYQSPVEKPTTAVSQVSQLRIEGSGRNDVDLLFMIDNSPSMAPKQAQLQARFPDLIKILDQFGKNNPAHYHIGVVTSDLGAGQFEIGGQCHPGGDGGRLQAIGKAAPASCRPPTGGVGFIDYDQLEGTDNLPAGQDLATTFDCMASVGDTGCGFEAQLESVYTALHDPPPENQGFLRTDATLAVVFVTDEDDCSAPPDTDLFDPSKVAEYGPLLSYRCTNHSIACGHPPMLMPYGDSGGNLNGDGSCADADPSINKLIPVGKYIDFFTQPAAKGGVKLDPNDVILADITAPTNDVESILADPSTFPPGPYVTCAGPADGTSCAVVLQHSCVAPDDHAFFGDPAVRLRQVVSAAANRQDTSICDTSYQSALEGLGDNLIHHLSHCFASPFLDPSHPDCTVEDVTENGDGSITTSELPECATDGMGNLLTPVSPPCWTLQLVPVCGNAPTSGCCDATTGSPAWPTEGVCVNDGDPGQHYGMTVCRDASCSANGDLDQGPANTVTRVECATVAVSANPETGALPACGPPL